MNDMTPIAGQTGVGIHPDIPNELYHAGPGISKSGLWIIHEQSPAHYKFPPPKEELTAAQQGNLDFGSAIHIAVLEPETFEHRVMRGPEDRKGNKWTDAREFARSEGKLCIVADDYDNTLAVRDAVHANARINALITGGDAEIEHSGYWIDPETGVLCRCRPDLYRPDLKIIIDLKSALSARPDAFTRSVINYGYHAQEAHYSDGYRELGREVDGFLFLAWEKKSPFAFGLYELPPSIVEEGRAIIRKSIATYAECERANHWPAYGEEVQELSFKRWAYTLTDAPEGEMEAA